MILGFRRDLSEICVILGFTRCRMEVSYRCFGIAYRFHLRGSRCLTLESGTDRLSRNMGTKLPLYFAENPLRAQISRTINVTYQPHLQGSITLKLQEETNMFLESSVINYRPTPRYFPEVRRPQLHHGGSLKSDMTVADSKLGAVLDFLNAGYKNRSSKDP